MPPPPEAPPHPRDWNFGIDGYLQQNKVVCEQAVPLTTGTSCYIWRLEGLKDVEASSNGHHHDQPAILKCADSTPKYRSFPVSPDRLRNEVKALRSKTVEEACCREPSVRTPRVLRETTHGFIMSWVGETDLRTAYKTDWLLDPSALGARLGRWLAALHLEGIAQGPDGWSSQHAELDKFYAVGGFAEKAIQDAMESGESDKVLQALRAPAAVHTLTPWDFRPMNVMVHDPKGKSAAPGLAIVDWELCHYGDPASDVRMWVAEVMVLEAKFGDRGMLSSFLSAYKEKAGPALVNDDAVARIALSAGVYMLWLLPINPHVWDCGGEDVKYWKETSLQYIRAGANGDMEWLKQSCLKPLLHVG